MIPSGAAAAIFVHNRPAPAHSSVCISHRSIWIAAFPVHTGSIRLPSVLRQHAAIRNQNIYISSYWYLSFLCFMTGLFKDFVVFTSIIFIHELGHIVTGLLFKWKIDKVIIFPLFLKNRLEFST